MTPGKKYLLVFFLLVLANTSLQAQALVKAYLDKDAILVGEPVTLTIEARFPLGKSVKWFSVDSIPHFEIIEKGSQRDTNDIDGKKLLQLISITSYDTGQWVIPRLTIRIDNKPYSTDTLSVQVRYSDGFNAEEEYREIKETEEVAVPFDKKRLAYIIGAIIVLGAILIYIFTRKKKLNINPVAVSNVSPFEAAIKAIAVLRQQNPNGSVETKAFYTSLNQVLRKYLSDQWKLSTTEKTNEELITQLSKFQLSSEQFSQLAQCLRLSDFVKFAKYLPATSDNNKALEVTELAIIQLNKTTSTLAV